MKNKKDFKYKEYEIIAKEEITSDTFLFRIKGKMDFSPGQFVQVKLDHFGEATFAPCSDPENKTSFDLCIRGCGTTTNQIIKLLPGDMLKIRGPYGNSWPIAKLLDREIVIIAGGLGLVPLKPLILSLLQNKTEFKKITLIVGTRSCHDLLFQKDLELWQKKINVRVAAEHVTKGFLPFVEKGIITQPIADIKINAKNTRVLMCGPEVMFSYCNKILLEKNISEKNIFISFERRMECGVGICQHCNIGKYLICKDGPVFPLDKIANELNK